ncbi:hypothetical protein [Archaeoglobus neptunius]|uniref:hypothetical protein n=1 Tax=Archaeoglobus neptunius TaxID=2798580 RepID=UPI001927C381|nr:hypothetical protein [Archaeoglobus neptunius]
MDPKMKEKTLKNWIESVLSGYSVKPVFEVVEYIEDAGGGILDGFLMAYEGKSVDEKVEEAIDNLMRFLATDRNLSPSESIRLVFRLRDMIADGLRLSVSEKFEFNRRTEDLILKAFDAYMACREKIFELRLKEKENDIEMMRKIMEYADRARS